MMKDIKKRSKRQIYKWFLLINSLIYNLCQRYAKKEIKHKNLFASPVNSTGKEYLKKIVTRFGHKNFEYLFFVYDNSQFTDPIFRPCKFIYEKGLKWNFARKYLTPEYCKKYDYIFFWDDDIDVEGFSCENFIDIMERNNLEVGQPSLSDKSTVSHKITRANKKYRIGRYTDFVEIMIPVYKREAWSKFWKMIKTDEMSSGWGWGYDRLAKFFCGYKNMGIIDSETVEHRRALRNVGPKGEHIREKERRFLEKHRKCIKSRKVAYGELK